MEVNGSGVSLSNRIIMLGCGMPSTLWLTSLAPVLPKMSEALAHDASDQLLVKMVATVPGAAMVIGAPLAGLLADKVAHAPLVVWATLLWALAGASGYVLDNLALLVATRLVVGLAASVIVMAGIAMISDLPDPEARKRLMGGEIAISTASGILCMPLAGLLGDVYWRLPFLIFLTMLPLALVANHAAGRNWTWLRAQRPAAKRAPGLQALPFILMLVAFCGGVATFAAITYMPFVLQGHGVTASTLIGTALMMQTMATAVAAALFGYARRWFSSGATFFIGFALSAVGLAIATLGGNFVTAALGLFLMGGGIGWITPNMVTQAGELATPETRGRSIGLVKGAYMAASFVTVLAFDPVLRQYGPEGPLLVCLLLCIVIALFYTVSLFRRRGPDLPAAELAAGKRLAGE